jgi:hypothetical protein
VADFSTGITPIFAPALTLVNLAAAKRVVNTIYRRSNALDLESFGPELHPD